MSRYSLSRRDFSKFAVAAASGIMAGSLITGVVGCSDGSSMASSGAGQTASGTAGTTAMAKTAEMHACAGLNGCKGQGADGRNACAGQGGCASAAMKHECKGNNACKGQGGCGEMMGKNECKGHGGCAVPMKDQTAWQKARDQFETEMKADGKNFWAAPAKT